MADIFESFSINGLELDNRFVRSATMDGMADESRVSEKEIKLYRELGDGGIGLIISHGLYPTLEGKCSPGQLGAHDDDAVDSLSKMTAVVHEGGGKIAAQILHGGWMTTPDVTGMAPVGPSAVTHPRSGIEVRELTSDEVYGLVEDYVQAAKRIQEAGFDGVQLHGAHSWILSAFLSPATNRREDEWGGSVEKRTALVREICRGIRVAVGPEYPVFIKLGIKDYHPEGKSVEEGMEQARLLEAAGFDAIEVSEGLEEDFFHHIRKEAMSPYYLEECRRVKETVSVPVILVGGMRKLSEMRGVIESGAADAVSLCRPFIMEPQLVKKLESGEMEGSGCTSCNECMLRMRSGELKCVLAG